MPSHTAPENPERSKSVIINICKVSSHSRATGPGVWGLGLSTGCWREQQEPTPQPPLGLHGSHVIFWKQWDLQDFGVGQDGLVAGGGDCLPRDPVDLVEGVGPQQAVVGRPNEQL